MADEMQLVVTLRKDVPDRAAGLAIFELIKARMADRPDVIVTGHVTNHFDSENET